MGYSSKNLDLRALKSWANSTLQPESTLRQMILLEKDEIEAQDFLNKIDTWQKLCSIETRRRP